MYLGTEEVINWAGIPVPDLILSQKNDLNFWVLLDQFWGVP